MTYNIFSFSIILLICRGTKSDNQIPTSVIVPSLVHELPPPIFYTSYVPLIFEIKVPQLTESDLHLTWPYHDSSTCSSSSEKVTNMDNVGCGVVHHLNPIIQEFYQKIKLSIPPPASGNSTTLTIACNVIIPHFTSPRITRQEWTNYWTKLQKACPSKVWHRAPIMSNHYVGSVQIKRWSNLLKKFRDIYLKKLNPFSVSSPVYTSAFLGFQAGALVEHLEIVGSWERAIDLCQSGFLPRHFVSKATLYNSLYSINSQLAGESLELSLGSDSELYYKLSLTDCVYGVEDKSLILRILVPVKPSRVYFKLVEIISIPFLTTETNKGFKICSLDELDGRMYIFEAKLGTVLRTECSSSSLCAIPHPSTTITLENCPSSLIKNDTDNILASCKLQCFPFFNGSKPIFKRVKPDTFIILGREVEKPVLDIFLSCGGKPFRLLKPKSVGALEVTLSCSCSLVYNNVELHAGRPCGTELRVRHVIPLTKDEEAIGYTTTTTVTSIDKLHEDNIIIQQNQDRVQEYNCSADVQELRRDMEQIGRELKKLQSIEKIMLIIAVILGVANLCALGLSIWNYVKNCGKEISIAQDSSDQVEVTTGREMISITHPTNSPEFQSGGYDYHRPSAPPVDLTLMHKTTQD